MKKKNIVIAIIIVIVIAAGSIGGFFFIKNFNIEKQIKEINEDIIKKMLDEKEINYLSENRFLNAKDIEVLNKIKEEASVVDKEEKNNLEKVQENQTKFENILSNLKDSLDNSIKDKIVELNNALAKLNPVTDEEIKLKDDYLKEVNKDINEESISILIKENQNLEEYKKKVIVLETEIKNSAEKKAISEIPDYLTREQILEHGVQVINFKTDGLDTVGKTFTPNACRVSEKAYADSFVNRIKNNRNELKNFNNAVDKKIPEYQHKDFSMVYYNSKYNQNTTITDEKTGKTYIVYIGSITSGCQGFKEPGGAALCIAYDYLNKKIVSVVGVQDAPRFIIDGQAIAFDYNFETGEANYKDRG